MKKQNQSSHFKDVIDFTAKFGLSSGSPIHVWPGHLKTVAMLKRIAFLREELTELEKAVQENNLADQADALVDITYVAMGTGVLMALPWRQLWNDVHRANMSKERLTDPLLGHKVGIGKPNGWVGPYTDTILENAGYTRSDFVTVGNQLIEGNCYDFL